MKFAALTSFVCAALGVAAAPTKRNDNNYDTAVLNYALTLEHLENAFYSGALAKFDANAFTAAGLPASARGRFQQIADHEATHVKFLSDALGSNAVAPCVYDFGNGLNDPKSFAALSQVLEGVGVTAYIGAAHLITNPDYLTAAASVLSTEARHASFVAAAVNGVNPWSGAFDVPLSYNEVFTLASGIIKSCPDSNQGKPQLPLKAFAQLTLGEGKVGDSVPVQFSGYDSSKSYFVSFFIGLTEERVPVKDGKVVLPMDLTGTVYAVVVNSDAAATDANTVAGPDVLVFPF